MIHYNYLNGQVLRYDFSRNVSDLENASDLVVDDDQYNVLIGLLDSLEGYSLGLLTLDHNLEVKDTFQYLGVGRFLLRSYRGLGEDSLVFLVQKNEELKLFTLDKFSGTAESFVIDLAGELKDYRAVRFLNCTWVGDKAFVLGRANTQDDQSRHFIIRVDLPSRSVELSYITDGSSSASHIQHIDSLIVRTYVQLTGWSKYEHKVEYLDFDLNLIKVNSINIGRPDVFFNDMQSTVLMDTSVVIYRDSAPRDAKIFNVNFAGDSLWGRSTYDKYAPAHVYCNSMAPFGDTLLLFGWQRNSGAFSPAAHMYMYDSLGNYLFSRLYTETVDRDRLYSGWVDGSLLGFKELKNDSLLLYGITSKPILSGGEPIRHNYVSVLIKTDRYGCVEPHCGKAVHLDGYHNLVDKGYWWKYHYTTGLDKGYVEYRFKNAILDTVNRWEVYTIPDFGNRYRLQYRYNGEGSWADAPYVLEEEPNGYVYADDWKNQFLAYSLKGELGDTITLDTTFGSPRLKVVGVDSIDLLTGYKRKRYQLQNIDHAIDRREWIVGMGDTRGVIPVALDDQCVPDRERLSLMEFKSSGHTLYEHSADPLYFQALHPEARYTYVCNSSLGSDTLVLTLDVIDSEESQDYCSTNRSFLYTSSIDERQLYQYDGNVYSLDGQDLLMDMSLEVGDRLGADWGLAAVTAVDTFVDNLGYERKRIHFEYMGRPVTLMEGIGYSSSFFKESLPSYTLLTYEVGDQLVYRNPNSDSYACTVNTPYLDPPQWLTLYPNPFTNNLNVISDETTRYQVFSALGHKVDEGLLAEGRNTINLAYLQTGVYLVKFEASDRTVTHKVLKVK